MPAAGAIGYAAAVLGFAAIALSWLLNGAIAALGVR